MKGDYIMDIKLLLHAKDYIDDLARGINPITKEEAAQNDVINDVRVSRCLFYVADVLGKVAENADLKPAKKIKEKAFDPSQIDLNKIEFSSDDVTVSVITERINAVKPQNMKKLKVTAVTNWLASIDALKTVVVNGRNERRVTQNGRAIGINDEEYQGKNGIYRRILYSEKAQRFIVDNLTAVIDGGFNGSSKENSGKPWSDEDDFMLKTMFQEGVSVSDIAASLKRSRGAIRSRVEKLDINY